MIRSLMVRLGAAFALLLLVSGIVQFISALHFWRSYTDETLQRLSFSVADEIAAQLGPLLEAPDMVKLPKEIRRIAAVNPAIDIYLLAADGTVIVSSRTIAASLRLHVPTRPLEQMLSDLLPSLPLYNDDPIDTRAPVVFSVARAALGTAPGYLYVTLRSANFANKMHISGESYLIVAGLAEGATLLVFGSLLGLAVFTYLTKGLRRLTETAHRYYAGDLSQRIDIDSQDEIGTLASTMNQMADRIQVTVEQLRETDLQRRTLVAALSHDLRGPLTAMRGYVDTLSHDDGALSADERARFFDHLSRSVALQTNLVQELFELSALEARDRAPECVRFDMRELVSDTLATWRGSAEARSIGLTCDLPESPLWVNADFQMIGRVLNNFVDNAIRYTLEGGAVCVRAAAECSCVSVAVADTGRGIPQDEQGAIFEAFYRAKGSPKGGTGLGLAIAKKILDLHDASVSVTSEVNVGTTFRFVLPQGI